MAGTRRASDLRAERAQILERLKAFKDLDFSKEFDAIMAMASGFQARVLAIDTDLERLAENDAWRLWWPT